MSNEFVKQYKALRKKNPQEEFENLKEPLKESLERALPPFPEAMVQEFWQYFMEDAEKEEDLEKAADLVDFCNDSLEVQRSVLEEGDWLFIRDTVNLFAMDLELEFVTYVMQVILAKGLIRKKL
ncbi:MAG: hypothetical protein PF447_05855 [Spirochaetaceae bacterium]|jgi:5'-deoxynucleotidase YfbR-like HD superfamily hydrolase|nr:hypothetical protein [Spirochaetaceae bacterium]